MRIYISSCFFVAKVHINMLFYLRNKIFCKGVVFMQVGISTACFYPEALEETFSQIADMGFKKIEIFFNTQSELHEPVISQIKNIVNESGLQVISIHPYTSLMEGMLLFSDYKRRTQDGFEQYKTYFEAAQKLGAKYLTFHGERTTPDNKIDKPDVWQRKIERYHRLCSLGKDFGVTVAQENVAWCKSSNPEYLKKLYKDVPELRYTLDLKQAYRAGHLWTDYYNIVYDRLKNIHINDFDDNHSCLLPNEGKFDYNELFKRLENDNYDGDVLIEVYKSNYTQKEQLENSAKFLKSKINY